MLQHFPAREQQSISEPATHVDGQMPSEDGEQGENMVVAVVDVVAFVALLMGAGCWIANPANNAKSSLHLPPVLPVSCLILSQRIFSLYSPRGSPGVASCNNPYFSDLNIPESPPQPL